MLKKLLRHLALPPRLANLFVMSRPVQRSPGRAAILWLAALVVVLAGCQASGPWQHDLGAEHPLAGRIHQTASERFVDQATLVDDLATADFVLLGERHDNRDHHRLQAMLVRELQAADPRTRVVALEMIPGDRQLPLVEYRQTHPDDLAGLGAAVGWSELGWPDWALYRPVVEQALAADAELVAADLSTSQKRAVFREGPWVLQTAMVRRTGLDRQLPAPLAASLAEELRAAHCGEVPDAVLAGMYRVQRARDAMMADRLATVGARAGGVLIAGNGHVRNDRGVPWYLARILPDARIVSVGLLEVVDGMDGVPPGLPFDYVWFTPRANEDEPCGDIERLRELEALQRS